MQFCRMRRPVDLLQLPSRDPGIDLRGGQIRMPQDRLDVADIGAVFQHVGCHRVAEQVAGIGFFGARKVDVFAHHFT